MKFSPSDWHGKFEGSTSYFAPNMQKGANGRGRTSPTRGKSQRNASERTQFSTPPMGPPPVSPFGQPSHPIPPPPPGPPPGLNFPPAPVPAHAAKFNPQDWNETFKDPNWVYNESKETSQSRSSEATKRPKAARKASVPQKSSSKTQDESEASRPRYQAFTEEAENGEPDAMDIDSGASSTPDTTAGVMPNGSATAPSSATTAKPPGGGLNGLGPDLLDPVIKPQANGVSGMASVGDALPFPSQASNSHPIKTNAAQSLKFPQIPFSPPPPTKLDLASADEYFNRMGTYIKSYRKYSKLLTKHFASRDAEMDGDLDDHFIRNRGETTKKLGFASYLAKMEEDESVMETWKVAQEQHITALQQCAEVRNKTMKLYQTPQN
jgi:hypothetical protein